jgi:ATP-dependent Lon protease
MLDGGTTIIIQGIKLFKIEKIVAEIPYLKATVSPYITNDTDETVLNNKEFKATMASLTDITDKCLKLSPNHLPAEVVFMLKNIGHPSYLIHFIASNLDFDVSWKNNKYSKPPIWHCVQKWCCINNSNVFRWKNSKPKFKKRLKPNWTNNKKNTF